MLDDEASTFVSGLRKTHNDPNASSTITDTLSFLGICNFHKKQNGNTAQPVSTSMFTANSTVVHTVKPACLSAAFWRHAASVPQFAMLLLLLSPLLAAKSKTCAATVMEPTSQVATIMARRVVR